MKRFLAVVSFVLLLSTLLVSCGNSGNQNPLELEYVLLSDDTIEVGCGVIKKHEKIIIPETYNDMPVTKIADKGFSNMPDMQEIILPDSIKSIGAQAFSESNELRNVKIPDSVTEIGAYAFYRCEKLESVKLSENITVIPERAFSFCIELDSVIIPNGVTTIGENAFSLCETLTNITIPDSVTAIESYVFVGCPQLTTIKFSGTEAEWNAIAKGNNWNGDRNINVIYNS